MRRGTAWLKLDERRMEFLSLSAEGCLSDSSCKAALFTIGIFAAFSLLPYVMMGCFLTYSLEITEMISSSKQTPWGDRAHVIYLYFVHEENVVERLV